MECRAQQCRRCVAAARAVRHGLGRGAGRRAPGWTRSLRVSGLGGNVRCVMPEQGEGYGFSSEAQPMYSWGALAGFIGLQHAGFYAPAV